MRFKDPPTAEKLLALKATGEKLKYAVPHYRDIPDYCPFRHCNSIVRLLMLIEGHNVIFDSASRIWTMLGIAKILDCPMVIRDKVTQWLMYGVNARFVEVLPEEALKIGFSLQLPDITQGAFRILVNELALELAASPGSKTRTESGATFFGRKRGDAGDELENLIQHAAGALCERVELQMKTLEEGSVYENYGLPEWKRMSNLQDALRGSIHPVAVEANTKLQDLMMILELDFKRSLIGISGGIQIRHDAAYNSIDQDRATYVLPEDFETLADVMSNFNKTQRRLCAFFYHDLMYLCEGLLTNGAFGQGPRGIGSRAGDLLSEVQAHLEKLEAEEPETIPEEIRRAHPCGERLVPVHLFTLRNQLDNAVKPTAHWWHRHAIDPPLNITRHLLLTLGPNELKFLPLWAGGNDDGTGGVFEPTVPSTEMGPNGPGPAFHTGMTIPSASSVSGSLMEDIRNLNVMGSTTAGSVDVHDSISTVYRPDQVIADDKSIATESFTISDSGMYNDARYQEPAGHQSMGKAVEMLVEDSGTESGSVVGNSADGKQVQNLTADDWELDDGSDDDSDTLSDRSMVML